VKVDLVSELKRLREQGKQQPSVPLRTPLPMPSDRTESEKWIEMREGVAKGWTVTVTQKAHACSGLDTIAKAITTAIEEKKFGLKKIGGFSADNGKTLVVILDEETKNVMVMTEAEMRKLGKKFNWGEIKQTYRPLEVKAEAGRGKTRPYVRKKKKR